MKRRDFTGKVVAVTGAAGGLGRALAHAFAAAGACVAALDCDAAACDAAIAAVSARWSRIDVLVNNAGISHRSAWRRTDPAVIRRVMEVNFFGAVNCTRAALDALTESRGLIIVISSVAGFAPLIARTGYAAAKHALHGFFDSLRSELADDGVDVLMICPSFIATGIGRHALGGDGAAVRHAQQIVGERARPEDIAVQVLRAAERGTRLLLPGRTSKLAWWVSRLAPAWYARAMARRLRGEML